MNRESPRVVANVLNCDIVAFEFDLQSGYYVYFRTISLKNGMNPLISPAISLKVVKLLFYKDSFNIE